MATVNPNDPASPVGYTNQDDKNKVINQTPPPFTSPTAGKQVQTSSSNIFNLSASQSVPDAETQPTTGYPLIDGYLADPEGVADALSEGDLEKLPPNAQAAVKQFKSEHPDDCSSHDLIHIAAAALGVEGTIEAPEKWAGIKVPNEAAKEWVIAHQ